MGRIVVDEYGKNRVRLMSELIPWVNNPDLCTYLLLENPKVRNLRSVIYESGVWKEVSRTLVGWECT